jgi:anthranilate phosphoribosyltransferase
MNEYIKVIQSNKDLSIDEMQAAINKIMSGKAGNSEIEQFLLELNKKGISEDEITGAALVMQQKSLKFDI